MRRFHQTLIFTGKTGEKVFYASTGGWTIELLPGGKFNVRTPLKLGKGHAVYRVSMAQYEQLRLKGLDMAKGQIVQIVFECFEKEGIPLFIPDGMKTDEEPTFVTPAKTAASDERNKDTAVPSPTRASTDVPALRFIPELEEF